MKKGEGDYVFGGVARTRRLLSLIVNQTGWILIGGGTATSLDDSGLHFISSPNDRITFSPAPLADLFFSQAGLWRR